MIDRDVVMRKLATLGEHVARARRRRPATIEGLRNDEDLQDALAMSVLVALQEAIDVAFHVVIDEGLGMPASNAEAFELLAKNERLSDELAARMGRAAGLRNRIAHGYASVDLERLWAEIPDGLDALERFAAKIAHLPDQTSD